jgi:hypothetical protein
LTEATVLARTGMEVWFFEAARGPKTQTPQGLNLAALLLSEKADGSSRVNKGYTERIFGPLPRK